MSDQPRLLRLRDVLAQTGLSRSSLYRLIDRDAFPRPVAIAGTRMRAWSAAAVSEFVESQLNQKETSNDH